MKMTTFFNIWMREILTNFMTFMIKQMNKRRTQRPIRKLTSTFAVKNPTIRSLCVTTYLCSNPMSQIHKDIVDVAEDIATNRVSSESRRKSIDTINRIKNKATHGK
jgi:hypothetical protein